MNDHDGNVALDRAKEAVTRVTLAQRADTAKAMKKPTPARTIKMVKRAFKRAGKAVADVTAPLPRPCRANVTPEGRGFPLFNEGGYGLM